MPESASPRGPDRPATRPRRDRSPMGPGLAVLNRVAGWPVVDRVGLRRPVERGVYQAARTGFRTVGATTRAFAAVSSRPGGAPVRLPAAADHGLFDLTPSDEQQMITAASAEFAAEVLRPAASDADTACQTPATTLTRSVRDLGVTIVGVPEALGGVSSERSATTNVLIAEALAHGDMGQAVAILAPAAVSGALVLWGDEQQQSTYLPAFVGDNSPAAALAVLEPTALFDPFVLSTAARRSGDGFLLTGLKSLVPRAAEAELFVVAARLSDGRPGLFLVESDAAGLSVEAEPAMGLRAASLGRLVLDEVRVPGTALLGAGALEVYRECIRLARLGWCALSLGTAQAVLDYVIPYVNDRVAFGEPVSHRQSVAFAVADIGIELEGMRLATYRAASRADQGHSFARESALARTLCASYGMKIGSNGVQLLGGHGFVKEHPVERWYRDLRAVGLMEGAILV